MNIPKIRPACYGLISLLIFACVAALVVILRPKETALPPVIVFANSYRLPSPIPLFAQWVPATPTWAWLWHLKEAVCGKIRPVEINTDIMDLSQTLTTAALGAATFDGPGTLDGSRVRVWLLGTADLKSLRQQFKNTTGIAFLNSPRITTGNGIGASLFAGETIVLDGATNETGVWVSYFTRVHQNVTDLTASLAFVESLTNEMLVAAIRTNLNVKARFQIPKGKGIFLLQSFQEQTNRSPVGVILSTKP